MMYPELPAGIVRSGWGGPERSATDQRVIAVDIEVGPEADRSGINRVVPPYKHDLVLGCGRDNRRCRNFDLPGESTSGGMKEGDNINPLCEVGLFCFKPNLAKPLRIKRIMLEPPD
jgi:hypothetical protein